LIGFLPAAAPESFDFVTLSPLNWDSQLRDASDDKTVLRLGSGAIDEDQ
jgi:hypothetical protein